MKEGHIRISRAIEDWRWGNEPMMVYFWLRIIIMANWKDKEWHNKTIKRGSFITTVSSLSAQLELSTQQVRTCLERLRAGGEIKTATTNTHTLITICKYDDYQSPVTNEQQTNNKPTTNEEQTNNKRITTTKEYKEEYNTSDTNVSSYSIQEGKKEEESPIIGIIGDEKRDEPASGPRPSDYFPSVLELWNTFAKRSVPKIRSLSPARKEKVKLRVKEMGGWESAFGTLRECFQKISESDFCNGATGKWAATFDWFFENEKNWLKVLEGNYDNRKEKSQLEVLQENIAKADAYYEQRYHGYGGASPYGDQTGSGPYGPDEQ